MCTNIYVLRENSGVSNIQEETNKHNNYQYKFNCILYNVHNYEYHPSLAIAKKMCFQHFHYSGLLMYCKYITHKEPPICSGTKTKYCSTLKHFYCINKHTSPEQK